MKMSKVVSFFINYPERRLKNMIQAGEKINNLREVIIYTIFCSSKFLELN